MKKTILLLTLIFSIQLQAQTFIKDNPIPAVLGVVNVGLETSIDQKTTFSFDVLASPWDFEGRPRKFCFFVPEVRYYFKQKFNGIYFGGHIAYNIFNAQKWTYKDLGTYQRGMGYLIGATLGYQVPISKKLALDCFIGGGWQQGYYKGYNIETGERTDGATNWNKSGDWYLYRGGIMVSYKI